MNQFKINMNLNKMKDYLRKRKLKNQIKNMMKNSMTIMNKKKEMRNGHKRAVIQEEEKNNKLKRMNRYQNINNINKGISKKKLK